MNTDRSMKANHCNQSNQNIVTYRLQLCRHFCLKEPAISPATAAFDLAPDTAPINKYLSLMIRLRSANTLKSGYEQTSAKRRKSDGCQALDMTVSLPKMVYRGQSASGTAQAQQRNARTQDTKHALQQTLLAAKGCLLNNQQQLCLHSACHMCAHTSPAAAAAAASSAPPLDCRHSHCRYSVQRRCNPASQ